MLAACSLRKSVRTASAAALLASLAAAQSTTWTGDINTTWDNADNWNNGVPTAGVDAVIAATANQPSNFLSDPTCQDLTIQALATLTLVGGFDLEVTGNLLINGTLTGSSSSDVTVVGDWVNSGIFTHGGSPVELAGSGSLAGSAASTFDDLLATGGTRTATQSFTVEGDLSFESGASVVLSAASYTVDGGVGMDAGTALELDGATCLVAGTWTSSAAGIAVTGTGTVEFTGAGTVTTGANSLPNMTVSGGTRSVNGSVVAGNLSVTGGTLQIHDGQTLTVNGNAVLSSPATLTFTNNFAGDEVLDVGGDCTITATAGAFDSESIVRCGGSWSSTSAFAPAGGTVVLDGGATADIGGTAPAFVNLTVAGGSRTLTTAATVASDLTVQTDATLTTNASLDIDGKVILGGATATWDLGSSTHTVAGNWSSAGGSATGTGTIEFDDPAGGGLVTGAGTIANVLISAGTRSATTAKIIGNLTMTGGGLTIFDNHSVNVAGNAVLSGGTLTFNDSTAGVEILDVDGDCTITSASGGSSANTLIRCGGDWSSDGTFALAAGMVEFDEGSSATVGGTAPALPSLRVVSGTKTFTTATAVSGDVLVDSGAALDTDAPLTIGGDVTLGDGTASWDLGASTHSVGGGWTSSGASATGAGSVSFDGAGGAFDTGGGTLANAQVTAGTLTVVTSTVAGNLSMSAGSLVIQDNQTLAVQGNASLTGGGLAFVDSTAGNEVLDVDGDLTLTLSSGGASTATRILCAGDYASSGAFALSAGLVALDGGTAATVSGVGTSFPNLTIASGTKTVADAISVAEDLVLDDAALLDTDASVDVNGKVLLGDDTAQWDIGSVTHTIAGNYTSSGASAIGAGTIEFDGTGGLITGGGTIANVQISAGDRNAANTDVDGNLTMTGGSLVLFDNQTLTVTGDLTLSSGTVTFADSTAGSETIDVEGDATFTAANGGTTDNTEIQVAGNWTSSSLWTPTAGILRLDGASPTTIGGPDPVLHDLLVTGSVKQLLSPLHVQGDLTLAALTTLDADAAVDVDGTASLNSTSVWDIGVDTHTVAGDLTTAGGSATGSGTLEFDGTGVLETLGGSVPNVTNSSGFRLCNDSTVTGNLAMTGGGLTIGDNQTLTVGGDVDLTAGQLTYSDSTAGSETLDVAGNADVDATAGSHNANSFLNVAGNWTSTGSYSPSGGTVRLDGGTVATVGGSPVFWNLEITSGTKTVTAAATIQSQLEVLDGATLDTDAPLDVDGPVALGDSSAAWDVGASTHTVAGTWTSSGASATGAGIIEFDGPGTLLPTTGTMPNVHVSAGARVCFGTDIVGNLDLTGGTLSIENDRLVNVSGDASLDGGTLTWLGDGVGTPEGLDVAGNVSVTTTVVGGETVDSHLFCGGDWSSDAPFAPVVGTVELDGGGANTIGGTGTTLGNLIVRSGAKTLLADATVVGNFEIVSGQSLVCSASLDVDGDVVLGDGTAQWDLGSSQHSVAGDWTSSGASAVGTGEVVFDGTGVLQTNPGSISNAANALGFRLIQDSTIAGNLSMTGGGITVADNQTLAVQGDVDFSGGQLTFSDSTAGVELIDIEGNAHVACTAGAHSANSVIRCAGDWSGNSGYSPAAGLVELDGAGNTTISGQGGSNDPTFNRLTLTGGPRSAGNSFTLNPTVLTIAGTSSFDVGGDTVAVPAAAASVNGALSIGPGGDLKLGGSTAVNIAASGTLSVVGSVASDAVVSGYAGGRYLLNIDGTLEAGNFRFSGMDEDGVRISNAATLGTAPNDLRAGAFSDPSPTPGSVMLQLTRSVPTDLRYVDFVDDAGVGTSNASVVSGATVRFVNSSGNFSGPAFEDDPFSLIEWDSEGTVLTAFTATAGPDQVTLDWTTSAEIDVDEFFISRSTSPGGTFTEIASTPATGPGSYQIVDSSVTAQQTYFYRLSERLNVGAEVLLAQKLAKPWSSSPPANFLTVGASGSYTDIQSALTAAVGVTNPMVVIEPGNYPSFTVTSLGAAGTLRILGDGTGPVTIDTSGGPVEILNMGLFENVEIGNMEIGSGVSLNDGLVIRDNLGTIVVDELTAHGGGAGLSGIRVDNSQRVAIQKCTVDGDVGLQVENGSLAVCGKSTVDDLHVTGGSNLRTAEVPTVATFDGGSVLTEFAGVMPDIDMPEFVSMGGSFDIDLSGEPGAFYVALLSTGFLWLDIPADADMVGLGNLNPGVVILSGALPGGGATSLPTTLPESGGFFGFPLVFQMIHVDSSTLDVRWSNVTTLIGRE